MKGSALYFMYLVLYYFCAFITGLWSLVSPLNDLVVQDVTPIYQRADGNRLCVLSMKIFLQPAQQSRRRVSLTSYQMLLLERTSTGWHAGSWSPVPVWVLQDPWRAGIWQLIFTFLFWTMWLNWGCHRRLCGLHEHSQVSPVSRASLFSQQVPRISGAYSVCVFQELGKGCQNRDYYPLGSPPHKQ